MKLENEFTVDAPVDEAWNVMLDLERVTPCLPGASLTEQEGDEYRAKMTVRLGPVKQEYNGLVAYWAGGPMWSGWAVAPELIRLDEENRKEYN